MKNIKFEDNFHNEHVFLCTPLESTRKTTLGSLEDEGIPNLYKKLYTFKDTKVSKNCA